jgi:hypothetical protein
VAGLFRRHGTFRPTGGLSLQKETTAMSKSVIVALTMIATTILFGYAGAALLASDEGRAIIGAVAALLLVATVAALARALAPRFDDHAAQ